MDEVQQRMREISGRFQMCRKTFIALGDGMRQQIVLTLLDGPREGMRVGDITADTSLSQPAVSHHLQILKDADIIRMRRRGTMNYYYMNAEGACWRDLTELVKNINAAISQSDGSGA
jgi:DNA-binding transcriptional ArsR family regulator